MTDTQPNGSQGVPASSAFEMTSAYRAVDANANRATEGIRVVEDYLRFHCQNEFLARTCKQLRHDLAQVIGQIPKEQQLAVRNTLTDIGTDLRTSSEYNRPTLFDLACANLRRAAEALRTLEEFAKVVAHPAAEAFESLRYRVYTIEKAIGHQQRAEARLGDATLYVLVDFTSGTLDQFEQRAAAVIAAGVDVIQLRDKKRRDRELISAAHALRRLTADTDTLLVINDRPDIACLVHADGVHVGQDEMRVADVRCIVGPDLLIGVSTHCLEQASDAVLDGADYLGVGPTFDSATKKFSRLAGLQLVEDVARHISLPAFAIGGIDTQNVDQVLAAGATRVAVSAAIWSADDPAGAVATLRRAINSHR